LQLRKPNTEHSCGPEAQEVEREWAYSPINNFEFQVYGMLNVWNPRVNTKHIFGLNKQEHNMTLINMETYQNFNSFVNGGHLGSETTRVSRNGQYQINWMFK